MDSGDKAKKNYSGDNQFIMILANDKIFGGKVQLLNMN